MKLLNSELYSALIDSGTSEDKAKAAAESVAEQFHTIDKKLDKLIILIGIVLAVVVLPALKSLFL